MLKVIIDYDDVLNDCNQAAIEKLNKEEGTRFLLSDIHKWGITRTLLDKRIEYFKDPLFMSTVPLRKGAKKFIKQLSKRYEVFIATSVHPDCAGVRVNEIIHEFPFGAALDRAKPVYTYMEGWHCDISACRKASDLPKAAYDYIRFIEESMGCPVKYVSVGAARDAYLIME